MNRIPPTVLEKLSVFLYFGTLGAFAALVGFLVQLAKEDGQSLSLVALLTTLVVGFYLGMLFGVLVPAEWGSRDAMVLLIGATGMKGFDIVSNAAEELIPRWFNRDP